MAKQRVVSDVEYTGLVDTTTGFTGSSTLDSSVDPGSPLQLVMSHDRNAAGSPDGHFHVATWDLWDAPDSQASLQLSGVSDPPFASADLSTPYPAAVEPPAHIAHAFSGLGKFGSGVASILGSHPIIQASAPSVVHGARSKAIPVSSVPSNHGTLAIVVIVVALVALLLNGSGGDIV